MARARKRKDAPAPQPILIADKGPPPAMPEWWEPPSDDVVAACESEGTRGPQAETWGAGQMVERLHAGCYALPPWQRGDVWTHEHRVAMLQTMMDGLPLPPVILWKPTRRDDVEHMPLADCPTSQGWGTTLVIDGRRAPSGEALSMGIYSDREPAVHGSYRWEAAPEPYAQATGDTFAQAERTLVRRIRRRTDPWPDDLETLVLDVLDPQRSDFAAYRRPAADARSRNIDTIRDAVADLDRWTDDRLQRVADAIRSVR